MPCYWKWCFMESWKFKGSSSIGTEQKGVVFSRQKRFPAWAIRYIWKSFLHQSGLNGHVNMRCTVSCAPKHQDLDLWLQSIHKIASLNFWVAVISLLGGISHLQLVPFRWMTQWGTLAHPQLKQQANSSTIILVTCSVMQGPKRKGEISP